MPEHSVIWHLFIGRVFSLVGPTIH